MTKQARGEFIYFMQARSGPIKVGRSNNIAARLHVIQTCSWEEVECIGFIERGSLTLERKLHNNFKEHLIRSEWFKPATEILDFIAANAKPWNGHKNFKRKMRLVRLREAINETSSA